MWMMLAPVHLCLVLYQKQGKSTVHRCSCKLQRAGAGFRAAMWMIQEASALGSMAEVENATQSTVNMTSFYSGMSNSLICPTDVDDLYDKYVEECWESFNATMFNITHEYWCNWEYTFRIYSILQLCLELNAERLCIAFPNERAHNTILNAHMYHFKNCSLLSEELMDPPENILFGLIFAPICIIPFLVTLVVYKSNTDKPQI